MRFLVWGGRVAPEAEGAEEGGQGGPQQNMIGKGSGARAVG